MINASDRISRMPDPPSRHHSAAQNRLFARSHDTETPKGDPGTFVVLEPTSQILEGKPARRPHVRKLGVWLPRQYDGCAAAPVPRALRLVGFTAPASRTRLEPFGDNVPERAARLIHEQKMGTGDHRLPRCFTAMGATST